VNLLARMRSPVRKSQIDLVPADTVAFLSAVKNAGLKVSKPKTMFLIEDDDRVGALTSTLSRLGDARINVTALSAIRTGNGRYGVLLWVNAKDVRKAAETLGV
jgi:hypothetical protein